MKKLAIITTHPIQYNAPFFKLLNESKIVRPKVFYTWGETVTESKFDPGFQKEINWDIPLLDGYEYEFVENTAKDKGSHHYMGIVNPGIVRKIESWAPDAVLVYGWNFKSHLKVMRHFKRKIPVWFRGDSILLNEKNDLRSFLKNILLRWVYKHIDIAFYTGTHNKIYFEKNGLQPHQLIRAFHAVDNVRFQNTESRFTEAALLMKDELGIGVNDLVFLYAGKLIPTKDIGNLIRSFKNVNNKNVHLIIVGNGPEEHKLKKDNKHLKNLHFLDFQNQAVMPVVYQACDVFVLPSVGETWGLSVNEAMAAGKAVLVSDKCGASIDMVTDGENGYVFKAGNVEDITFKMMKFVEAKENLKIMRANSLKKIRQFTFDSFVVAIENVFRKSNV